MHFHVMTLFPELIEKGMHTGVLYRAMEQQILSLETYQIRDHVADKHKRVDDYTYGGGAGMLIQAEPVYQTYRAVMERIAPQEGARIRVVYATPQGRVFDQAMAEELAKEEDLVFLCGHYEGIDERVLEEIVTDHVSIGDYVLTGGELPALVMMDAVSRLIPGVLNNDESAMTESFNDGLLEYPQYTRPEEWHGKKVPEILLSGHHGNVEKWRLEQSLERTKQRRPDLYEAYMELHPPQPEKKKRKKKKKQAESCADAAEVMPDLRSDVSAEQQTGE
ncbi:MAG: tRNA (guanosine(37)-N1)-methyltransferase TrmD [Lachnospiraceae bacterium]|nr:tRNA (guanosine(37)-N1)-methyltransferase TrmD [Lachnospiraceae bacterium]